MVKSAPRPMSAKARLRQPANCPFAQCAAIVSGERQLRSLENAQAKLRQALARERLLVDLKNELIRQKELFRRESDHRLLNGLHMVAGLLSAQSRLTKDAEAMALLNAAASRVVAISAVHRRLSAPDHRESIALKTYLQTLCSDIAALLPVERRTLAVQGIEIRIPRATCVPLGLIVTELITNSAKYGNGSITVRLRKGPHGRFAVSVSDDGPGLPQGFDPTRSMGLGMKIISSLVNDIGGDLSFGPVRGRQGARFTVTLPRSS